MKSSTLTRLFSTAAVIGALAVPAIADEHEGDGIHLPGASAAVSLDYVTNYFFRGIEQTDSDSGAVFQPGAEFTIPVVGDFTATIGTWGSIHTDADTATANPSSWFEQDIYASIDGPIVGDFSGSVGLTYYTFPSAAANGDITELSLAVSFDDSAYFGDFAFAPYVAVAVELQNNAGADENTYLEIGGEFSLDSLTEGTFAEDWTWVLPIAAGFSLDTYYADPTGADEFFGFVSIGAVGSIPLADLIGTDEYVGAWDLTVGVYVLLLNNDAVLTDNSGNYQVIGQLGISREW